MYLAITWCYYGNLSFTGTMFNPSLDLTWKMCWLLLTNADSRITCDVNITILSSECFNMNQT